MDPDINSARQGEGRTTEENLPRNANPERRQTKLYKQLQILKRKHSKCIMKRVTLKSRVNVCLSLAKFPMFDDSKLHPFLTRFFKCELHNAERKNRGKRYSLHDKIVCLSVFNKNPKAYPFLSKMFSLPSFQTLRQLLQNAPATSGISESNFQTLARRTAPLTLKGKLCILMFHEVTVQPSIQLTKTKDLVEGLCDERSSGIADHMMVWMLKGIYRRWKQPIAYNFSQSTTSVPDIMCTFKTIVQKARKIGLRVVASICDQSATNARAINKLLKESKHNASISINGSSVDGYIVVNKIKVVPLYDPTQLMKCLRNNLLTKDLKFCLDGVSRVAKWSHIVQTYWTDFGIKRTVSLRLMYQLSKFEVCPYKIKRNSNCTKIFSQTVAAAINLFSVHGKDLGATKLGPEIFDTAALCYFLSTLYGSLSGVGLIPTINKELGLPVKIRVKSPPEIFWCKAMQVVQTMEFVKRKASDRAKPAVLQNIITTLDGFQRLRDVLEGYGCNCFAAWVFNQNALKNFLGLEKRNPLHCTRKRLLLQ